MIGRRLPYLPQIDGLRGIAVLAVVTYHLNAALLRGGFVGVDVFFVISGFVVSRSMAGLEGARLGAVLGHFYAHRVVRIVPALVVCLVLTMLANALFIPQSWLSGTSEKTGLHAFFGLSNLILARTEGDYFAPKAAFNPFTHTWSLGVEEQFYLVFPLLFILWLAARRGASLGLFAGCAVASFIYAASLACADPSLAFYGLASRFWELGVGVVLLQAMSLAEGRVPARAEGRVPARDWARGYARFGPGVRTAGAILGVGAIMFGMESAAPQSTPFPGSLLPCLGAAGLICCLDGQEGGIVARALGWRGLRGAGQISYSLYLWHWPVFVVFRWTTGLDTWPLRWAALALALAAASASYRWVETPFRRRFAESSPSHLRVLALGILALGGGYGVSAAILSLRPAISLSTVSRNRLDWYQDMPRVDPDFPGCTARLVDLHLAQAEAWSARREGCALAPRWPKTLFVLGDSHATAYTVMLRDFVRQTGATLLLYSEGGCSFFGLAPTPSAGCAAFESAATQDILRRLRPGDVIFLPSLRLPRLVQEYASLEGASAESQVYGPEAERNRAAAVERITPILKAWSARGADIVFEAPIPVLHAPPFRCADWFDRTNPICAGGTSIGRAELAHLRAPVMAAFGAFQASLTHVHIWDPLPVLCPDDRCQGYRDGKPLFFDGDHLSGFGNRVLLPDFEAFVIRL